MRVAIIGAGGQVGSEVTLRLASVPGLELVPVVRSRQGSAFLRYHGIRVRHCDITEDAAGTALAGADVVANFALAGGTGVQARDANERIVRATFDRSDQSAVVVFFSTLAVGGSFETDGGRRKTAYGALKVSNERLVASLARTRRRAAFILRLGHVAGTHQQITRTCRDEILASPVVLPDPQRLSNVTHTVTIADALLAIGDGRAGTPGRYDLVNVPQWTWQQVYEHEAADLGVPVSFSPIDMRERTPQLTGRRVISVASRFLQQRKTKALIERFVSRWPGALEDRIRASYYADRARREIASLTPAPVVRNPATFWPALDTHPLQGLESTDYLLASSSFKIDERPIGARWPEDQ